MTPQTYSMAGRRVRLHWDQSPDSRILERELAIYPQTGSEGRADLDVFVGIPPDWTAERANPPVHFEMKDGFMAVYPQARVGFRFQDGRLSAMFFETRTGSSGFGRLMQKWKSIQYTTPAEGVGQVFHEMVLVPSTFFEDRLVAFHASAWELGGGGAVLVGGTGGVGKTSLQLEFCGHRGRRFLADDISILTQDGTVWPNLSHPKIYAYNVPGDPHLESKLWKGRGELDRLHWQLHLQRGPSMVRRRMSPVNLYEQVGGEGCRLAQYVILAREARGDLQAEAIDAGRAAEMSAVIMRAEYDFFLRHLLWHQWNCLALAREPVLTAEKLADRWKSSMRMILSNVTCRLVRVPESMDRGTLGRRLSSLLGDESE